MTDLKHDHIFAQICEHCGVAYRRPDEATRDPQNFDLSREVYQKLNWRIGTMHAKAHCWERPGHIENQLEDARKKLTAAIEAVESLDNYAKVLARNEALKERDEDFKRQIVEIGASGLSQDKQIEQMNSVIEAFPPIPPEEYIDHAAIAQLKKLRDALVRPIEAAIPSVQEGPGRPRNRRAYAVAEYAYQIFEELTGQKPTFWNGKETTPFGRMVEFLFEAYGIKSTIRKPIEAAMHKFNENG